MVKEAFRERRSSCADRITVHPRQFFSRAEGEIEIEFGVIAERKTVF